MSLGDQNKNELVETGNRKKLNQILIKVAHFFYSLYINIGASFTYKN
jgi:hypothetical protein